MIGGHLLLNVMLDLDYLAVSCVMEVDQGLNFAYASVPPYFLWGVVKLFCEWRRTISLTKGILC
uniref:Uncharacterized protein n=1 Tax=Setaria italica TaxID=4555 RepID=K3Y0Q3_SETIT